MRPLFDYGARCAQSGRLWTTMDETMATVAAAAPASKRARPLIRSSVPVEGRSAPGGGHEMNARLEPRAIGRSNHSASAPLLAQQWMRDRDYFTLHPKAPGNPAGDRVAATAESHCLGGLAAYPASCRPVPACASSVRETA